VALLILIGCSEKDPTILHPEVAVVKIEAIPLQSKDSVEGRGFLVSADGLIVTTLHNVDGATRISVTRADGSHLPAQLVQTDIESNLAIISVRGVKFPFLKLQVEDATHGSTPGAHVRAITPDGISHGTFDHWESLGKEISFTAKIGPHDSGAPLMGDDGLILGVAAGPFADNPNHFNGIPIWRVIRMMPALTRNPLAPITAPD
jgi:S1-C subfamily serine protease